MLGIVGQEMDKLLRKYVIILTTYLLQTLANLNWITRFSSKNIRYSLQAAESTDFTNDFFDLIVVAQAIHWFDFEKFYAEVNRTLRKDGLLVVLGYGKLEVSEEIDAIITKFYREVIGPFWDKERKYIDENYQTIPFLFDEIKTPKFANIFEWTFEHLIGYLETWSAVKTLFS